MPRGVDGDHPFQPEVPFQVRLQEGCHHGPRRAVDVDLDVESGLGLDAVQGGRDPGDRFVASRVGDSHDRDHTDGVLVYVVLQVVAVEYRMFPADRHVARLHVPVVAELLPAHLHGAGHHQVGAVRGFPGGAAGLLPATLQRQAAQHRRLRRPDRRGADRVFRVGGVPQVGEHLPAAGFDLRGAGVLVLVDHVLVRRLQRQAVGVIVHPGADEGGQVEAGVAVEHRLVVDDLVGGFRQRFASGQAGARQLGGLTWPGEEGIQLHLARAGGCGAVGV